MTASLIAFLAAALAPLVAGRWPVTLLAMSTQGFLLAVIAGSRLELGALDACFAMADLVVVRGLAAPLVLSAAAVRSPRGPLADLIPANAIAWLFAVASVPCSYSLATKLAPLPGELRLAATVAGTIVLLAFLILTTASDPAHQMIGALYIENAAALLELAAGTHPDVLWIRAGQLMTTVTTIALYRWYLELFARPAVLSAPNAGGRGS